MYYGIIRAVIHDMRFRAHYVSQTLEKAYDEVIARPSSSNLATRESENILIFSTNIL
jgi:hypothetical protein